MPHIYPQLSIAKIIEETAAAKTFLLEPVDGALPPYRSGQFINLVFPGLNEEHRRSYSFSSSFENGEPMAITVKYVPNGIYSRRLVDYAQTGDRLSYSGISGLFTLPPDTALYSQLFFFAAGSGITPVFALIKTALKQHPHLNIRLVYSNRSRKETIFYEALCDLQKQYNDRFAIKFLFSVSKDLLNARLNNFMITDMMQDMAHRPFSQTLFYICGPFEYMDTVIITLLTEGVPREHIYKENFATFIPQIKAEPPDRDAHEVRIVYHDELLRLRVQYPTTILQQAKAQGIVLPYSCESGQCGSCSARCTSGKVWMYYNEVLTDRELKQGMVLTCTGFPVEGDVELRYD